MKFLDNVGTIDNFNFDEAPVEYVKTIIGKMKSSSAGYDNIPISVFKHNFDTNDSVLVTFVFDSQGQMHF